MTLAKSISSLSQLAPIVRSTQAVPHVKISCFDSCTNRCLPNTSILHCELNLLFVGGGALAYVFFIEVALLEAVIRYINVLAL